MVLVFNCLGGLHLVLVLHEIPWSFVILAIIVKLRSSSGVFSEFKKIVYLHASHL